MSALMLRFLQHRCAAASACAHCFNYRTIRLAAFIIRAVFLLVLLVLIIVPADFFINPLPSSMDLPLIASSPSDSLRIQPFSSQDDHNQADLLNTQGGEMRLHRRLGFNLEKTYEIFKRTSCQGDHCRRRPGFHILHAVPSGPNPISNYLPSSFYDRFSTWAPAPPPF